MADPDRATQRALIADVVERGAAYGFFEIVRLLQQAHPDAARVGHQGPPAAEVVRFRPPLDMSFPASDVREVHADGERRFEIASSFLSLYGVASPLPACFTEELLYEDHHELARDFLDIFNHRLNSLFYRAWEKYRHLAHVGRSDDRSGSGDDFGRRARTLSHLERATDPLELLASAGLLHQQPMSEVSLERILARSLGLSLRVRSCVVRWTELPAHRSVALGGRGGRLGQDAWLGSRLREATTTFAVEIDTRSREEHLALLPEREGWARLQRLLERLAGELECELVLRANGPAVSPAILGDPDGALGWNTWIGESAAQAAVAVGADVVRIRNREVVNRDTVPVQVS